MKKNKILIAIVAFSFIMPTAFGNDIKKVNLKSKVDSLNYALGLTTGSSLEKFYLKNDSTGEGLEKVLKGIKAGMKEYSELETLGENVGSFLKKNKENGLMNNKEIEVNFELIKQGIINGLRNFEGQTTIQEAKDYLEATSEKLQKEQAEKVKKEGENFLLENAKKEGVVQTESGLQYKIEKTGEGEKPKEDSEVKVHYHGTLIDGTVFDSSVERGTPAQFPVNGVIPGWTEALQLMNVGSKWILYIPQELAYGERKAGLIPPFSTLIFEVELIGIEN